MTVSSQTIAESSILFKQAKEVIWQQRGALGLSNEEPPSGLPKVIWQILRARGFETTEAMQSFLTPSLKGLRDPFCLRDLEKAVERLVLARTRQEPIVVYADYDLDGTSGLALTLQALSWLGFKDVTYYQPKRLSEGYGLHKEAIEKLYASGRRLMLSIDLGITAIDEVAHANALGMDVIITDHHLPKETLPAALAVVNPNRGDCPSGLSHLCGTGVAFYLMLALRRTMLERGLTTSAFDPKRLLDCFVIGTLTDMVPLIDENRALVKHGLLQLARTERPGLRALLAELDLWGRNLTSQEVAIRFAPKINALSRMETGIRPIDLYLVSSDVEAQAMVEAVIANNQDRQKTQKSAEAEALEMVHDRPPKQTILVYSQNFHRGVVGLVATRLCQEFNLPSFVGALEEDQNLVIGSVRMPDGAATSALEAMASAHELFDHYGGHAAAAGFAFRPENAEQIRARLDQFFAEREESAKPRVWLYDVEAALEEFNLNFMNWYEHLGPFGMQMTAPVFRISQVRVKEQKTLKGGHLRLTLSDSRGKNVNAIWFSPPAKHPMVGSVSLAGSTIDVLAEPQWNYFAGSRTLQLLIADLRASNSSQRESNKPRLEFN